MRDAKTWYGAAAIGLLLAAPVAPAQAPPDRPRHSEAGGDMIELRHDAKLRERPRLDAPVIPGAVPEKVLAKGTVQTEQGTWWHAELEGGRPAFVLQEEIVP